MPRKPVKPCNPNIAEDVQRFAIELGHKSQIKEYHRLIKNHPKPSRTTPMGLRASNAQVEFDTASLSQKAAIAIQVWGQVALEA